MIKIRNIHKTFGENTILRGIDLDVGKGQVVVILGPSGSGKTTFLRCLNALEMPEQGQIEFDNAQPLSIDFSKKKTKQTRYLGTAPQIRHGVPTIQPLSAQNCVGKRHGRAGCRTRQACLQSARRGC